MNKSITTLHTHPSLYYGEGLNRMFRVYFQPDKNHENFEVGMSFNIVGVNRTTGEIQFSMDHNHEEFPKEVLNDY